MKHEESIVQDFLRQLGCSAITYEPDGNVPPDFSVGQTTGVEARRLNQLHIDGSGKIVGLEQADMALWSRMNSFINNYSVPTRGPQTYGVFYTFSRPIPKWSTVKTELDSEFGNFLNGSRPNPYKATLPCGIGIRIFDWKRDKGSIFRFAGSSDEQSGGYIVGNLQFSLQWAISEKQAKISKFRYKYSEWWLVLVDYVSLGTDEHDRRQLFDGWGIQHAFDKVYVVNPHDVKDFFEV
jgi:hypothetical protein